MWRELLTPLPHVHRILRLFFSLCIYFASHCRSLHPIWKCLFSFTINFAEIWHMSLTEDLKCFLQQAVRDWLRTKANLRAVRVWTKPECLLLPCVFFSPKCYSWSLGGDRACPAPAWNHVSHGEGQGGTHSVKHSNRLCSVPVALSAKESSNKDRRNEPSLHYFFFPKL